jgi:polar amino acid transport system permease protein
MLMKTLGYILQGTGVTIAVTLVALPMGFLIGLILSIVRVYGGKAASGAAGIYSTVMRGIPPLVLLFILYFIISGSINLSPFWAGSLSLGIISSGYQLEILRGALQSVGSSQMMAARALGMTRIKAIRYIVLPQALRIVIPSWANEASVVLKDSSLVYALGVPEIIRRAQYISASTYEPFLALSAAAIIYFVLVFSTNRLLDLLEARVRIPGLELSR